MHINNSNLTDFQTNRMDTDSMISFLEHLDQCDYCLEQMLEDQDSREQQAPDSHFSMAAPAYMKESILNRTNSIQVHAEKKAVEATHRMQLFYEGIRTVVGVALALIMLFSLGQISPFTSVPGQPASPISTSSTKQEARDSLHDFSSGITDGLSESSEKLLQYMNSFSSAVKHK